VSEKNEPDYSDPSMNELIPRPLAIAPDPEDESDAICPTPKFDPALRAVPGFPESPDPAHRPGSLEERLASIQADEVDLGGGLRLLRSSSGAWSVCEGDTALRIEAVGEVRRGIIAAALEKLA
jgi:hypothetical protein